MPGYNEVADIDVINGNMDKIDVQMKKNADSAQQSKDIVSDEYSATNTYAVGDYCIHENVLYKCKTAITTGEAFDSNKWVQTTCGTEFGELNSNLTDLKVGEVAGGKNLLQNGDDLLKESSTIKNKDGSYTCVLANLQQISAANPFFKLTYKNNAQYTISMNVSNTIEDTIYLIWHYDDGTTTDTPDSAFKINNNLGRIAVTSKLGKTCIGLEISYGNSKGKTTISDIQIEEGTTATPYEPYIPSVKMIAEEVNQLKNDLNSLITSETYKVSATDNKSGSFTFTTPQGYKLLNVIPNCWATDHAYTVSVIRDNTVYWIKDDTSFVGCDFDLIFIRN